jgi:hypothetical protein
MRQQDAGGDCIMRSFMICTVSIIVHYARYEVKNNEMKGA